MRKEAENRLFLRKREDERVLVKLRTGLPVSKHVFVYVCRVLEEYYATDYCSFRFYNN